MIPVLVDYATPSVFESNRERTLVGMSANARRPVRFHGRVMRNTFLLRVALRALGEAVWSDDTWASESNILDPVITVHPDRLFFEAFSQDQSVYASVIVDPDLFETEGEVVTGTTNVDFTAWLWAALAELRTSRRTWFRVESAGFEVKTFQAGGRFEKKVELPDDWVRGFLNLQEAMAMPGTRLTARAVDVLAAIRFLRYTKSKISPRALRFEFEPDREARIVLEPWEQDFPLKGAEHNYTEQKTIRTWGRRRLRLIEPLLPFAEQVDIYLKGRALPSFYAVKLPGITFVLGLSGWTAQRWTESGGFSLLSPSVDEDKFLLKHALEQLRQNYTMSIGRLAETLDVDRETSSRLLVRLCRLGRAIYDLEARSYRHRELFEEPVDEKTIYPPDPRLTGAREILARNRVAVADCSIRETRKIRKLSTPDGKIQREIVYRDWHVNGSSGDEQSVEIVINDSGRIIFGTCGCEFFTENLLNKGPCEHMLALFVFSEGHRRDKPTSFGISGDLAPGDEADPDEESVAWEE